jgi:hypothetical protein
MRKGMVYSMSREAHMLSLVALGLLLAAMLSDLPFAFPGCHPRHTIYGSLTPATSEASRG